MKLGACGSFGVGIALTAAGTLLPLERTLFLLLATASGLGSAFLALCVWPSSLVKSPRAPASLLAVLLSLFPVGTAIQSHIFHHATASRGFGAPTLYRAAGQRRTPVFSPLAHFSAGCTQVRLFRTPWVRRKLWRHRRRRQHLWRAPASHYVPRRTNSASLVGGWSRVGRLRRQRLRVLFHAAFCIWINHTLLGGTSRARSCQYRRCYCCAPTHAAVYPATHCKSLCAHRIRYRLCPHRCGISTGRRAYHRRRNRIRRLTRLCPDSLYYSCTRSMLQIPLGRSPDKYDAHVVRSAATKRADATFSRPADIRPGPRGSPGCRPPLWPSQTSAACRLEVPLSAVRRQNTSMTIVE